MEARVTLLLGKGSPVSTGQEDGMPHSQSGCGCKEKNPFIAYMDETI